MQTTKSKAPSDRYLFEVMALRLEIHGPAAATRATIRQLVRSSMAMETQWLLRSHGFSDADIAVVTGIHPKACACWECVRNLHRAVLQHVKKQQRKTARTYRRRVPGVSK